MPGITAIISKYPQDKSKYELQKMLQSMMHEDFYSAGKYINDQFNVCIGWVCRRGEFSDCMPIYNENKDLVLFFSGENYADIQLINDLKSKGHDFDSFNASYIIHLYEEYDDKFLDLLNGYFNGILIDTKKGKIFLFNDRIGNQKLYYYENNFEFILSTEVKALQKFRPELKQVTRRSLGEYFACSCALENRTLFRDIFLLPGGSVWTFIKGKLEKSLYFDRKDWENQPILDQETFYAKIKEVLSNILPRYLHSKDPITVSLTGGLDSRIIMAVSNSAPGRMPCFTFAGPYRDNYDVRIARIVADVCGQKHYTIRINQDFFSNFSYYAEKTVFITDGCLSVHGAHEIYLNKLVRQIAPIRITGNSGSEVLRSHSVYKTNCPDKLFFDQEFYTHILEGKNNFNKLRLTNPLSDSVFREIPWLLSGRSPAELSQVSTRTPYVDKDLLKIAYQAPRKCRSNNEISLRIIADNNANLGNINTNEGVIGGMNSLKSRISQLLNFFLFKADYYYDTGMPHIAGKFLPIISLIKLEKTFVGCHRLHHYRPWFQNEVASYVKEILLDQKTRSRSFLNGNNLERMVGQHIKGDRNYANEINKLLTVELIHRLFID